MEVAEVAEAEAEVAEFDCDVERLRHCREKGRRGRVLLEDVGNCSGGPERTSPRKEHPFGGVHHVAERRVQR